MTALFFNVTFLVHNDELQGRFLVLKYIDLRGNVMRLPAILIAFSNSPSGELGVKKILGCLSLLGFG